jgi:hypothetical protein
MMWDPITCHGQSWGNYCLVCEDELLEQHTKENSKSKCASCAVGIDLDDEGGHIYDDGGILCPSCETNDEEDDSDIYTIKVKETI